MTTSVSPRTRPPKRLVPLLLRKLSYRLLVISALVCIVTAAVLVRGVVDHLIFFNLFLSQNPIQNPSVVYRNICIGAIITSLVVLVHHTCRIWPRRYWLFVFELLMLTVEIIGVSLLLCWTFYFYPSDDAMASCFRGSLGALSSMVAFSLLAELWDLFNNRGTNIWGTYNMLANHSSSVRTSRLEFVFGRYCFKGRFHTDTLAIRILRGLFAGLLLLALLGSAIFVLVVQPIKQMSTVFGKTQYISAVSDDLGLSRSMKIAAVFNQPFSLEDEGVTMDEIGKRLLSSLNVTLIGNTADMQCGQPEFDDTIGIGLNPQMDVLIFVSCAVEMPASANTMPAEILVTIDFSSFEIRETYSRYVFFLMGMSDSMQDIIDNTSPTMLVSGMHLYGYPKFSIKEKIARSGSTALGIRKSQDRIFIADIQSLAPSPIDPENNTTATLRLAPPFNPVQYVVEQEYMEHSVLSGLALMGGIWTSLNGLFAMIFGSTLLLVLLGVKPLSIYGLIHIFQRRRGFLTHNSMISPEEQARTVSLLREHLFDIESTTEVENSSPGFALDHQAGGLSAESDELVEPVETGGNRWVDAV